MSSAAEAFGERLRRFTIGSRVSGEKTFPLRRFSLSIIVTGFLRMIFQVSIQMNFYLNVYDLQ
jgi:hypothetical protein